MKLNVRVTRANINRGEVSQPNNCPIARALKSKLKRKVKNVSVLAGTTVIELKERNKTVTYKCDMPEQGCKFVKTFDRGLPVTPISLQLEFKRISQSLANTI